MKEKGAVGIIILVLVAIGGVLVASYFFFLKPRLQLNKARTPDSTLKTKSIIPRTKIEESGLNVKLIISPSKNDIISGEVTIEAANTPKKAENVGFLMVKDINESGTVGPNLGFDTSVNGGWTKSLDTTEYSDGEYYIGVVVFGSGDADSDPIGGANAKVLIDNSSNASPDSDTTSAAKTKIVESGMNAEIEIAPSKDKVVSGEVTITAYDVPDETGVVGFVITENKDDLGGGTILGFDSSLNGGWTKTLDTTEYDNGKYYVYVLAAEKVGANPIASASVRLEIKN